MTRFRYLGSALFLFLAISPFVGFLSTTIYGSWTGKGGDSITQSANILIILVGLWLFSPGYRRVRYIGGGASLAIALAGFLLLSTAWSADPATTVRRGFEYLIVVLGSIGIASSIDSERFMRIVLLLFGAAAVASLAFQPGGITSSGDFWGIFGQKNVLGQGMAAGVLASLHCLHANTRKRVRTATMLVVFILVGLISKSTTSILVIFTYCALDVIITLFGKGGIARLVSVILLVLLGPIVTVGMFFPDWLLAVLGKDPTLTGRTELWDLVRSYIAERPVVGWGYYAFWSPVNPAEQAIWTVEAWRPTEAHNALLEILLNVGLVGTSFFIFLWGRSVRIAVQSMGTPARGMATSSLLLCIGLILEGMTESVMVEPFQVTTCMFFITGMQCEQALRLARRQRLSMVRHGDPARMPRRSAMIAQAGSR